MSNDGRNSERGRLLHWVQKHWHILGGVPFLILAFALIIVDRIPGAALSGAIFLALILLPDIENLKAFGLFEANLKKATDLLEKLKAVSRANADLTYNLIGVGSRLHGLRPGEKQKLADASDQIMKDLGATSEELSERRRPYLEYILYDLYSILVRIVQDSASQTTHAYQVRLNSEFSSDPANPEAQRLVEAVKSLSNHRAVSDPLPDIRLLGFRNLCRRTVPGELIETDRVSLLAFADRLGDVGDEVLSQGRATPAALALLDARNHSPEGRRDLYIQVFGREPA